MTGVWLTAVILGLLAVAIAFACRLSRSVIQDPKMMLLNTLMRYGALGR